MFDVFLVVLAATLSGSETQNSGGVDSATVVTETAPAQAIPNFTSGSAPVAEDQTPTGRFLTATEVKPILTATKPNWIAIREWDGQDLIYVTQIWSWRCGLLQLDVSINDLPPETWPLPDCHIDNAQPAAILESDGNPYRGFQLNSVHTVSVTLTYDDLSTDTARYSRAQIKMP